ncbi:MAG: hypothetical protein H6726_12260 [Sandaracinaceae bacterium]|nr:hypothetical protein [Sandaracinaceae bacterium]
MSVARSRWLSRVVASSLVVACAPLLLGAEGDCGPAFARDPAPDMSGAWNIAYDDSFTVKVTIGAGAARREYMRTVSATGGTFQVPLTPDGSDMLTFDLDCTRPEVVCPSEVWPSRPSIRQNHPEYTHRIFLQIPQQTCSGNMVSLSADECGGGARSTRTATWVPCDSDVTVVREASDHPRRRSGLRHPAGRRRGDQASTAPCWLVRGVGRAGDHHRQRGARELARHGHHRRHGHLHGLRRRAAACGPFVGTRPSRTCARAC